MPILFMWPNLTWFAIKFAQVHGEKFQTLISNSWPIIANVRLFLAHASIEMYGVSLITINQREQYKKKVPCMMDIAS